MVLYKYAPESGATDVLTDEQYQASLDRRAGAQVGLADRALNNKALKQATLFLEATSKMIMQVHNVDVVDTMSNNDIWTLWRGLFLPPGVPCLYAGTTAPPGFFIRDGSLVSRTEYPEYGQYHG